jgi:very-short-patch-repair endonuclease
LGNAGLVRHRRFLDADFDTFCVEIDGGFHIRPLNYWDDARRQNDLLVQGDRILRFPSVALRLEPEVVVAQLRAARKAFG